MSSRHLHPRRNLHFRNTRRQQVLAASNHTRRLLIHMVQASKSSHLPHPPRKPQYPKPAKRTQLHHEAHQPHIVGRRNVIVLRVSQSLRRPRSATSTRIFHLLYGKCLERIVNNIPHEMSSAMMKIWKLMRLFLREKKLIGQTSTLSFGCVFYYLESNPHFLSFSSARIAKKEDLLAIQEEERHEEEKRRRKREKERAAARGQ